MAKNTEPVRPGEGLPRKWLLSSGWLLVWTAAIWLSAQFIYYLVFSRFRAYDDEGFILISLKSFLTGKPLYDQVYSCYQPFFYEFCRAVFSGLGIGLCHDNIRLLTIVLWLAGAVVNGFITHRLTRSALLSLVVSLATVKWFAPFSNEPGHPQTLAYLLTSSLVLSFCFIGSRNRTVTLAAVGTLLGMLVLTKINIGLFAGLAVVFILTLKVRSNGEKLGRAALAGLVLLAPLAIMRSQLNANTCAPSLLLFAALAGLLVSILIRRRAPHWDLPLSFVLASGLIFVVLSSNAEFRGWAAVFAIAAAVLVLTNQHQSTAVGPLRETAALGMGALSTFALTCAALLYHGSTLRGLLQGLVLLPARQSTVFYVPWRAGWLALALGLSGCALALAYVALRARGSQHQRDLILASFKALFGLITLGWILWCGTTPMSGLPHFWMFPFAWLVVVPPFANGRSEARAALLAISVLQILVAFPIPGSQLASASVLAIIIAAVCLHDGAQHLLISSSIASLYASCRSAGALALAFACLFVLFQETSQLSARYATLTPLDLPGAARIRLDPAEAAQYQALASTLARPEVGTFLTMPGINSLYFWAKKDPPTDLNATTWMTLIDESGQAQIWEAAREKPGLLLVRNQLLLDMWLQGRSVEALPLVRHLEDDFITVTNFGGYEVRRYQAPTRLGKL